MDFPLGDELKTSMVATGVWQEGAPLPIERLARVPVTYVDFDGRVHDDGEIIVMDVIAEAVAALFERLRTLEFPLASVRGLHHYGGSDDASMADNNTSSFNCRHVEGSSSLSLHAYGLAIDINPLYNPFVVFDEPAGKARIFPSAGWRYMNRRLQHPGMVEPITPIFHELGFSIWGGDWTTPIDYHHFQVPRGLAELLAGSSLAEGRRLFELARSLGGLKSMPSGEPLQASLSAFDGEGYACLKANAESWC
ncbi:MAG: M15 family metallopeptidase [Candidatus Obscuribacterales bacterium]